MSASHTHENQHIGIVISNYGNEVLIEGHDKNRLRAIPKQSLPALVTGDRVAWTENINGYASIDELHERHGTLSRLLKNNQEKIIATNIDTVIIVCSHKPAYNTGLIDRYLAACEMAQIKPLIVYNKIDILPEKKREKIESALEIYNRIGYPVCYTSAKNKNGIHELLSAIHDKTSVLVGQSGVGKSSIIRAIVPGATPRVSDISDSTQMGRHTTTHTELYHLSNSGIVIDSPGIREFGLAPVNAPSLAAGFIDFVPHIDQCRFRNCRHMGEPDCALDQAVKDNLLSEKRLESYRNILVSFQNG